MSAFNGSIYLDRPAGQDALALRIYRYEGRRTLALAENGAWMGPFDEGEQFPLNPGVIVHTGHGSKDFVKALRAACDEWLREPEPNAMLVAQLREDLNIERSRVDNALRSLLEARP